MVKVIAILVFNQLDQLDPHLLIHGHLVVLAIVPPLAEVGEESFSKHVADDGAGTVLALG